MKVGNRYNIFVEEYLGPTPNDMDHAIYIHHIRLTYVGMLMIHCKHLEDLVDFISAFSRTSKDAKIFDVWPESPKAFTDWIVQVGK